MKIICTKHEFAELIRACYTNSNCDGCILSRISESDKANCIEDHTEIMEDEDEECD